MIATQQHEYHVLERESSDLLLEHDSRRVLGRFEEAAYDALQAGRGRARMGQLRFAAGEYAEAIEDWLSAIECFLRATAKKQASDLLTLLHKMEAEGKLPAERPDLHAALREREQGLGDLSQREQRFLREIALQGHQIDRPEERTLDFLLQQVRGLPGLALLHYAIYRQASDLRRQELAVQHLVWATTFDAANANLRALLGYLYLAVGSPDRALTLGNDFLAAHSSDTGPVRIMMANAYGLGSGSRPPDQERALDVLRPLLDGAEADERERIAAMALSATFQYEIGREPEYSRLLQELNRLEGSTHTLEVRTAIADFRELIPHPDGNGNATSRQLPEAARQRLFQKAKQVSLKPILLAA
jgi:tetratricopeptide (TPR) repeat protein